MSAQGFSTTLIHRGEGAAPATPLTTPIYETSTFVFENAEAVRRYNEGGSGQYLYSRYENPTVVAVEQKLAAADGAEQALVFSSGMATISTILLGAVEGRRRGGVRCGHLWRYLPPAPRPAGEIRHRSAVHHRRRDARAGTRDRRSYARLLVRVAEQPAPALRGHPARRRGLPGEGRRQRHRQHVCQPAQPAPVGDGCRPGNAERDEVPQRSQRRHRGRRLRVERAGATGGNGTAEAGRCARSASRLRAESLAQDARDSHPAPQRRRDGGCLRSRRASGARGGCSTRAWRPIRITGSRSARCPDSAAWCASTCVVARQLRAGRSIA